MTGFTYFTCRRDGQITEHRPVAAPLPPLQPTRRQRAARRRELEQLRRRLLQRSIIVID